VREAGLIAARSRLDVSGRGPGGSCVGTVGGLTVEAALSFGESEGVRRGSLSAVLGPTACPWEAGSVR
jgi:hypothetical protein